MIRIIKTLKNGTSELMCHPAFVDEELKTLNFEWMKYHNFEQELLGLTDQAVINIIRKHSIKLTNFKELIVERKYENL